MIKFCIITFGYARNAIQKSKKTPVKESLKNII